MFTSSSILIVGWVIYWQRAPAVDHPNHRRWGRTSFPGGVKKNFMANGSIKP